MTIFSTIRKRKHIFKMDKYLSMGRGYFGSDGT